MTTQTEMWLPKVGDIRESRDALIKELESKGWKLEGCGTGLKDNGEVLGRDIEDGEELHSRGQTQKVRRNVDFPVLIGVLTRR